ISRDALAVTRRVVRPVLLRWRPIQARSRPSAFGPMGIGLTSASPPPLLMERRARGQPLALEVVARDALQWGDVLGRAGVQGAGHRRWLGAALAPKGPLYGGIHVDRDVTLGHGLGPPEHAQHPIEALVDGVLLDHFLRHRDLLLQGRQETPPPQ